jgi:CubicO group peptidase (beta-lactamase class C family)
MRMKLVLAAALIAGTAGGALAWQAQPSASARATLPAVQAVADRYVAEKKAPGVVIAVGQGNAAPVYAVAGRLGTDAGSASANPNTLWRIYSMTKPVTGMAAMLLIEDGKLKLDQPISDFIPAFKQMRVLTDPANSLESRPATTPITVRHLLTHTAGLGYTIITKGPLLKEYERLGINPASLNAALEPQMAAARPKSLEEFANRVATLPLIAEPGTVWSYSIGLDVLGRVIEVASGMPFDRFLQTRIFGPLKMTSTSFQVASGDAARLADNYTWMGDNLIPIDPAASSVFLQKPSFPYGGAGLVSSARDYDRFLHMLANGGELDDVRVMKPETARLGMSNLLPRDADVRGLAALSKQPVGAQGFGAGGTVALVDQAGGARKGTYGWAGAAGTYGWVDPGRGTRVTIMVNYFPSDRWPLRTDVIQALTADAGAPRR